mgnify:CR=1 FL=1
MGVGGAVVTGEFIFVCLTLATWIGWASLLSGIHILLRSAWLKNKQSPATPRPALVRLSIGAVLLMVSTTFLLKLGSTSSYQLPLIWVYTSIGGWMLLLGGAIAAAQAIRASFSLNRLEKSSRLRASVIAIVVAIVGWIWMSSQKQQIWVLKGSIPLSWPLVVALIALAVVTFGVIIYTEKAARQRGLAKKAATHAALIAGSILFGLPFFWLLSTSFKEERDLMNANGIVWIPKTQETHPYRDPENPLFRTHYQGRTVRVKIDRQVAENRLLVEVERPYGMRGRRFETNRSALTEIPRFQQVWRVQQEQEPLTGITIKELGEGRKLVEVIDPVHRKGERIEVTPEQLEPLRKTGLRWENYTEALEWMPFETYFGIRYLINSLWLVVASVVGTVISCSLVAYGFSRLRFPGRNALFALMLATMMLPAAVTMLPQFLIFRNLGWVDTLLPLWVPTFFGSAFYIFLLRQFFSSIPMELEEAARIDGCGYFRTYWQVMMPQVKPALAVIAIWTFMSAWNNFLGPLIYISTPEKMPLAYALHLFSGDRGSEPHLMMAFATLTVIPVVILFFSAQKYFIESVTLTGMGGK